MNKFKQGAQVVDVYERHRMTVLGMAAGFVICARMEGDESKSFSFTEDQLVLYEPIEDSAGDTIIE